jgi:serine/threonine-protein kinase
MPQLSEVVSRRWAEAKAQFESSVRSGSQPGANVDVDAILNEIAGLIKQVGRQELESIAHSSGATPRPAVRVIGTPQPAAYDPARTSEHGLAADPSAMTGEVSREASFGSLAAGSAPATDQPLGKTPTIDQTGDFSSDVEPVPDSQPSEEKASRRPPTVPGYEITGILGRGGMGVVYKAVQSGLKRAVALKMILSGEHASAMQIARFSAEARAVALIKHPGIVQIYEIGEHDGLPYFSLEFCPGGSLDRKTKHEPQPPRAAAAMMVQLARAMYAAHTAGVIHRDLKPANVLLDADGAAKITDFGLARELDDADGNTRTGSVLGTPSYMAPEQALGKTKEVGPASDQYSLGATLYELLTGRPPFQGTSIMDTLDQVCTREPVPPVQLIPSCPKDLETICLKAMQKEPAKRYATCEALADDLQAYLDGRPISARPVSMAEKAWRWAKRNPRVAGLGALVALLLLVLGLGGTGAAIIFDKQKREAIDARNETQKALESETKALNEKSTALASEKVAREAEAQGYTLTRETVFVALDEIPTALQQAVFARGAEQLVLEALGSMLEKQLTLALTRGLPDRAMLNFHMKMGDLAFRRGKVPEARKHYDAALVITARLMQTEKTEKDKAKGNHALMLRKLGNLERDSRRDGAADAIKRYAEAIKLQREVLDKPETNEIPKAEAQMSLASTLMDAADLYRRAGVFAQAEPPAQEAIKLLTDAVAAPKTPYTASATQALAEAQLLLGRILASLDRDEPAEKSLAAAMAGHKKLLDAAPTNVTQVGLTARAAREYGDFLLMRNKLDIATPPHELDLGLTRGMLQIPELVLVQAELADVYYRSATLALKKGNRAAAEALYRKCLDLRLTVAEARPKDARQPIFVANAQARCGQHADAFKAMDAMALKYPGDKYAVRQAAFNIALCADAVQGGRPEEKLTAAEKKLRDQYTDRALTLIEQLVALGYSDAVQLKTDPDLDFIRPLPRFQAVVKKLEQKKP